MPAGRRERSRPDVIFDNLVGTKSHRMTTAYAWPSGQVGRVGSVVSSDDSTRALEEEKEDRLPAGVCTRRLGEMVAGQAFVLSTWRHEARAGTMWPS